MKEREKRAARKLWKKYKRNGRARAKAQNNILTPPNSPKLFLSMKLQDRKNRALERRTEKWLNVIETINS